MLLSSCHQREGIRGEYNLADASVCIDDSIFPLGSLVGLDVDMQLAFYTHSIVGISDDRGNDGSLGRYFLDDGHLAIALEGVEDTMRFVVRALTRDSLVLQSYIPDRMLMEYMVSPRHPAGVEGNVVMEGEIADGTVGAYSNVFSNMIDAPTLGDSAKRDLTGEKFQSFRRALQSTHQASEAGSRRPVSAFDQPYASTDAVLTLVLRHNHKNRY